MKELKVYFKSTAQLEFWETFRGEEFLPFIINANELIKSKTKNQELAKEDSELSEVERLLGSEIDSLAIEKNPLIDLITGQGYAGGPVIAIFDPKNIDVINQFLSDPEVRSLLSKS